MLGVALFSLILAVMVSCSQVHNQDPQPATPVQLLPSPSAGWRETGKTLTFSGAALSDYIDGGAEAYMAYGFREAAVREFQNDVGTRLTVEIYLMDRPENAYGIFSTDSAGDHWDIGAGASYGGGLLRFWKGPYFMRIMCFPQNSSMEGIIREMGVKVANQIKADSKLPKILSLLPETGIYPDTVCYFHRQTSLNNIRFLSDENLLHLGDGVEALTWVQVAAAGKLRHIVLLYPSGTIAADAFRDFTGKYLQSGKISTDTAGKTITALLPDGKYAAVNLDAAWLVIVLDAPSGDSAGSAVGQTEKKLDMSKPKRGSS